MPSSRFAYVAVAGALLVLSGCTNSGDATNASAGGDYCQTVQDYVPPEDCADFEKQAARQTPGTAAFNAPNPLDRGASFTVWLAVAADRPKPVTEPLPSPPPPPPSPSPSPPDDASGTPSEAATDEAEVTILPAPPSAPTGPLAPAPEEVVEQMPGHVEHFTMMVGEFVAADLQGDDTFEIKPLRDRTQRVHLGHPYPSTVWGWQVTPKRGGNHMMTITTTVQVKDREGNYWNVVSTPRSYGFKVEVTALGYLQDSLEQAPFWLKLVTGVVAALTALVLALGKLRSGLLELLGLKKPGADDKPPPQG